MGFGDELLAQQLHSAEVILPLIALLLTLWNLSTFYMMVIMEKV